ncbi:30S ribosomal protein S21 [Candidatus Vidania fulgoroideorum]
MNLDDRFRRPIFFPLNYKEKMMLIKKNNESVELLYRRYKKKLRNSRIIEKIKKKRFYERKLRR